MFDRIGFKRIGIPTFLALIGATLIFTAVAAGQTTWYVDDDAPNDPGPGDPSVSDPDEKGSQEHPFDAIQEGIDAAVNGDEVVVADGTYTGEGNRDLDYGGKAITVRSENGPDNCIIDCESAGRGFYFHCDETVEAVVSGFTITDGHAIDGHGGGISCLSAAGPTIRNCLVTRCEAYSYGGGIACAGTTTITDCTITDNETQWCGGGICAYGEATIDSCTCSGNTACIGGGGWFSGDAIARHCTFASNAAQSGGGAACYENTSLVNCTVSANVASGAAGLYCDHAASVIGCAIVENTADYYPGGLYCSGNTKITNCLIAANETGFESRGGAVYSQANPTIANCTIATNEAIWGAGVYCDEGNLTLVGCTISQNNAFHGGAIYCWGDVSISIVDSILWDNTGGQIYTYGAPGVVVTYSDVQGGWPGEGNIDTDPMFLDLDGPDNDPYTYEDNDYHLSGDSPCIDAGDNDAVPLWVTTDLDGRLRFVDRIGTSDTGNGTVPIVDMGAYEYQCTGDLNGDGEIDLSDLAELLASYGTTTGATYADGDVDQDSDVDLSDLAALLSVYGTTCE